MQVLPQNRLKWLKFALFPFKAFIVIVPLVFFVSASFKRLDDEHFYLVYLLGYDAMFLLFAALVFASIGPKGFALPAVVFGLIGAFIAAALLPAIAVAR